MRETIAEVMAAGVLFLSPHPAEQPATAAPAPHIEILVDNEASAPPQLAQPENSEQTPIDSIPMAISESLDPDTLSFWLEFGVGGGLGLTGLGGFVTSRRLKGSLRRNHADIKDSGWEAQTQLADVLEAAKQQAAGLKEDDVLTLRKLIAAYDVTSSELVSALASTDVEFDAERNRFFPLKRRLGRAPNTKFIVNTTQTAAKRGQELQAELDKVQTDLIEIDANIDLAESTLGGLRKDLDVLTRKGWDVGTYEQRAAAFVKALAAAQAKRAENYIDEPVQITKTTIAKALKLQEKARALEPRRAAADEVHGTKPDRIAAAQTTAGQILERFTRLQATYSVACIGNFENLPDELSQVLANLISMLETGDSLTATGKA